MDEENMALEIPPESYMKLLFETMSEENISDTYAERGVRILTELGICYTFNNLLFEDIRTEKWGDKQQKHAKLDIESVSFFDTYPMVRNFFFENSSKTFTLYIHSPYEVPTTWTRKAAIINTTNFENWSISIRILEVVNKLSFLHSLRVAQPECNFFYPSNLKMFPKTYTQNLCVTDCRARYALQLCGCIPHFYARLELIDKLKRPPICSAIGLNCLSEFNKTLFNMHGNSKAPMHCNCLPNCESLLVLFSVKKDGIGHSQNKVKITLLRPPRYQFSRNSLFSGIDLAVSVGNVISVFLGFNVLGSIEMLYYFSIRLYWSLRTYHCNNPQ